MIETLQIKEKVMKSDTISEEIIAIKEITEEPEDTEEQENPIVKKLRVVDFLISNYKKLPIKDEKGLDFLQKAKNEIKNVLELAISLDETDQIIACRKKNSELKELFDQYYKEEEKRKNEETLESTEELLEEPKDEDELGDDFTLFK